ncbi:hypothetical protein [Ardenticatena maritima]|nr:hypothetical protein [Ardenticatena maritima]
MRVFSCLMVVFLLAGCTAATATTNQPPAASQAQTPPVARTLLHSEDLANFGETTLLLASSSHVGTPTIAGWDEAATAVFSVQTPTQDVTLTLTNTVYRFPSAEVAHTASTAFTPTDIGVVVPLAQETGLLETAQVQQLQAQGALWRIWKGVDGSGVVHMVAVVHVETYVALFEMTSFASASTDVRMVDATQAQIVAGRVLNHVVKQWLSRVVSARAEIS